MPNIKPVSDLRNYNQVISEVSYGHPVYLTKNGRGSCVIIDMRELDELRALKELYSILDKGEASAREKGWMSLDDVKKGLDL